jgi:hypothetical protein
LLLNCANVQGIRFVSELIRGFAQERQ